ncbi:TPA: hypothetical protein ACQ39K_004833 [Yersinia enterocolitica]
MRMFPLGLLLATFAGWTQTVNVVAEGDIGKSTCNIPLSLTRAVAMGEFTHAGIMQALNDNAEGMLLKQQEASLAVDHCPAGMTEVSMTLAFNAFDGTHPGLVMPSDNPYTGVLVGVAPGKTDAVLTSGAQISAPVVNNTATLPVYVNAYATRMPGDTYSLGQSTSEIVFTLSGGQ